MFYDVCLFGRAGGRARHAAGLRLRAPLCAAAGCGSLPGRPESLRGLSALGAYLERLNELGTASSKPPLIGQSCSALQFLASESETSPVADYAALSVVYAVCKHLAFIYAFS